MDFTISVVPPFGPEDLAGKKFAPEAVVIHFVDGRRVEITAFGAIVDAQYFPTGTPHFVEFDGSATPGGQVSGKIHLCYADIKKGGTYAISLTFDRKPNKTLTYPYDLIGWH